MNICTEGEGCLPFLPRWRWVHLTGNYLTGRGDI